MLRRKSEVYKGHQIAAAPGTHKAVIDAVAANVSQNANILDLGAYDGAMLRRLQDSGYCQLAAADLSNRLSKMSVPFKQCDFNTDFSRKFGDQLYDCIIACEVIEHLDDPRHFMSQCRNLLTDEGIVIVSTPNIAFFEGRIKFFLKGELWGYGAKNYRGQRHISPISIEQFPILFDECGFELTGMVSSGSFASPLRWILTAPLWLPMRAVFGQHILGESLICVGRRKAYQGGDVSSLALWGLLSGA